MFLQLRGLSRGRINADIDELLEAFRLTKQRHDQVVTLSGGTKKKLSILLALIGGSKVKTTSCSPRAFPSTGVAKMVMNISLSLCPVQYVIHFPHLFYTSISILFSLFLSVSFLELVHLPFFLERILRPVS